MGRSALTLLFDAIGGPRQNWDKLVQLVSLILAFFRPGLVRKRLWRLRELGHIHDIPKTSQLLVAARDQMMLAAAEETKVFYRSQGIPWFFHNFRRFIAGPATMPRSGGGVLRRATSSSITCCRRFIATRSTTSCSCARTKAGERWSAKRRRSSTVRTRISGR